MNKKEPTQLQNEIKKRGLSLYKIVERMGFDSQVYTTFWSNKINGRSTMTPDELAMICKAITNLTKQRFIPDQVDYETERLRLI